MGLLGQTVINCLALVREAWDKGASDLHIAVGAPPTVRIAGRLIRLDYPPCGPEETEVCFSFFFASGDRSPARPPIHTSFTMQEDTAYELPGLCRLRVHAFRQMGTLALAIRFIPYRIPEPRELGLPEALNVMCRRNGLVLVTGPAGSGKSTTLAATVQEILNRAGVHVITIEDPIEFRFKHSAGLVSQREVGVDCSSFHDGLVAALREDPDVIVLGELRDAESADAALVAAETGHLVLATMHTPTAVRTIDRFMDLFPAQRQELARSSLSMALNGIVAQRLLPSASNTKRVLACEVLIATSGVRNLIRKGEHQQIGSAIETGARFGMCTMKKSIEDLVRNGMVTSEQARAELSAIE